MTIDKKRRAAVLILAGIILSVCVALFALPGTVRTAWGESGLNASYMIGTRIEIPARELEAGGETADAVSVVRYPDGRATTKTDVLLDVSGAYTVDYTARIAGEVYREQETFYVYDRIYSVGDADSSVEYGSYVNAPDVEGLVVRLAKRDTLTFNSILDVSEATQNDVLVELFVAPNAIGKTDFSLLTFTFTDVIDPSCTLTVTGRHSPEGTPYTYYLAGGNGQPLEGYESATGRLHVNNTWGTPVYHSFAGSYSGGESVGDVRISLRYDAATKMIYAGSTMIIDLDNANYFSTLWDGFPSGKVRLSVSASEYSATTANFVVTGLLGVDLSTERVRDNRAPTIEVNADADNMPLAKVGMAYPLPDVTATDETAGNCIVNAEVFYNYSTENRVSVPLIDGVFTPQREGNYVIAYTARDYSGNEARAFLSVKVTADVPPVVVEIPEDVQREASLGILYALPAAHDFGGSGPRTVTVRVLFDGLEIEVTDGAFRPQETGDYEVVYTVADYIGQTDETRYVIHAEPGEEPVFIDEPSLPKTFVSGSAYALEPYSVYDYTDGTPQTREAEIVVTDAAGSHIVRPGESYVPTVETNGEKIQVDYSFGGHSITRYVPGILAFEEDDEGRLRLHMENYLLGDGVRYEKTETSIDIFAERADGGWQFARELISENFEAVIAALPEHNDFRALVITLTDSRDPDIRIQARFENRGNRARLYVGDSVYTYTTSFEEMDELSIAYADGMLSVGDAEIDVMRDGFAGFPSRYLYIGIAFEGADVGAGYSLTLMNGQPMTSSSTDRIRPKIVVLGDYGGSYTAGAVVTLPAAIAADVFDPNITFSVTVRDPSGNVVTDVNGLRLENVDPVAEYTVVLSEYGQYIVGYTAADTFSGRDEEFDYAINSEDSTSPQIEFEGTFADTAKVGDILVIPDFTVSDNADGAEELIVMKFIVTSDGNILRIPDDSNAVRVTHAGIYQFRIMVTDTSGNMILVKQQVTVTE